MNAVEYGGVVRGCVYARRVSLVELLTVSVTKDEVLVSHGTLRQDSGIYWKLGEVVAIGGTEPVFSIR
jgi:hypothetical protein